MIFLVFCTDFFRIPYTEIIIVYCRATTHTGIYWQCFPFPYMETRDMHGALEKALPLQHNLQSRKTCQGWASGGHLFLSPPAWLSSWGRTGANLIKTCTSQPACFAKPSMKQQEPPRLGGGTLEGLGGVVQAGLQDIQEGGVAPVYTPIAMVVIQAIAFYISTYF